jgi:hypothetical protein
LESTFGLSPALLQLYARVLRESGARVLDNRGRGTGAIGARDTAHLLIAILGSWERPKDALSALSKYGRQLTDSKKKWVREFQFLPVPSIMALPNDHMFADALTTILESLSSGEFETAASTALGREADLESYDRDVSIEVTFSGPSARSSIKIALNNSRDSNGLPKRDCPSATIEYWRSKFVGPGNLQYDPPLDLRDPHFDLRFTQTFTNETLFALAKLLREHK